jgi:CHASE3 domain sensor protein
MSEKTPDIPSTPPPKKNGSKDAIYITIIILLLAGAGFLFYEMKNLKADLEISAAKLKTCQENVSETSALLGSDNMEQINDDLRKLMSDYDYYIDVADQMGAKASSLEDSLTAERQKIAELQQKIRSGNYSRAKLVKELETLRKVNQEFVRRITSLDAENKILRKDLTHTTEKLTDANKTIDTYKDRTKELEETVSEGQGIRGNNLRVSTFRLRSNGNQSETDRARRAEQIKACLTVLANPIARSGVKNLYMIVKTPSGTILQDSPSNTFNKNGAQAPYTFLREIDYNKDDLEVCIYYSFPDIPEAGTYNVEVWADGKEMVSSTFDLK